MNILSKKNIFGVAILSDEGSHHFYTKTPRDLNQNALAFDLKRQSVFLKRLDAYKT